MGPFQSFDLAIADFAVTDSQEPSADRTRAVGQPQGEALSWSIWGQFVDKPYPIRLASQYDCGRPQMNPTAVVIMSTLLAMAAVTAWYFYNDWRTVQYPESAQYQLCQSITTPAATRECLNSLDPKVNQR
jgi:hypothetical protein